MPLETGAMIICFCAVAIIAVQSRKEELAGDATQDEDFNQKATLGLTLALCAAIFQGCLAVLTRSLKNVH